AALAPKVKAVADKLPASEPDSTKYLVEQLKSSLGACKPAIMALATVSIEGLPSKQAEKLAKDLPAGVKECGCKLPDADVFEWGTHIWFGSWAPALAWIAVPKVASGDKKPIGKLVAK